MQTQKFYQRSGFWFCCTLLWCVVIFCFSAQDATQSNAVSNGVLHKIAEICTAWIPADAMDLESSTHTSMAFLIRKIAHFTLYFILGLLSCATMMTYCLKKEHSLSAGWFCAWAFCIFYATTDEFHQLFVPGRTGRLLDIGIDSCGALLG
ncbi:MAG: VanZ family protein, partial [Ruminococcus sp.]|nr:VanZ family protein [Ruminococcus sp.]